MATTQDQGIANQADADDSATNNPNDDKSESDPRIPQPPHVAGRDSKIVEPVDESSPIEIILQDQDFRDTASDLTDKGASLLSVNSDVLGNPKLSIKDRSNVSDGTNTAPQHFTYIPQLVRWLTAGALQLIVKSVANDYLVCRLVTLGVEGVSDILVAKPHNLRVTPWNLTTRDGLDYAYASATKRTVTDPVAEESQIQNIVPRYVVNFTIIYAMATSQEILPGIFLYDTNTDARMWAEEPSD